MKINEFLFTIETMLKAINSYHIKFRLTQNYLHALRRLIKENDVIPDVMEPLD